LRFFIPHWGLPYAQNPSSKAVEQLKMFSRQPTRSTDVVYDMRWDLGMDGPR